jgi:NEDD8-activating enzyme E1 regulatory subunit
VNLARHTHHQTNIWCSKNEKEAPTTEEERKELEGIINEYVLKDPNEENFEEAIKFSFKSYTKQYIPDEVLDIINDERATNLTKESTDFWFMVNICLKQGLRIEEIL